MIKGKKNVGKLKYLLKFLPLKTLDQMYKTLVRSHLVFNKYYFQKCLEFWLNFRDNPRHVSFSRKKT